MIEIYPNLFVGDQADYDLNVSRLAEWAVVHACKEPYHRQALGYKGLGAPKNHPEYLVARRGNGLILNMVDANNPAFFSKEMIEEALDFINVSLSNGMKVLVHCNLGESRSPAIALLFLATRSRTITDHSLEEAESEFLKKYSKYHPNPGLREHMHRNWDDYCHRTLSRE